MPYPFDDLTELGEPSEIPYVVYEEAFSFLGQGTSGEKVTLTFDDDKFSGVTAGDLQQFLTVFTLAYQIAPSILKQLFDLNRPDPEKLNLVRIEIQSAFAEKVASRQAFKVGNNLSIVSLSYNSPLEIVFAGALSLLTVAVIVSGGSLEFGKNGVKAKLPPLGTGIKTLRASLRKRGY